MSRSAATWRAVGFDLDDTLFDHTGSATDAVREFLTSIGFAPEPGRIEAWFALESRHFEEWRAGRISFAEQRRRRMREFIQILGSDPSRRLDDLDQLFTAYLTHYRQAWRAFPDAAAVLSDLRERGLRIGVLTNGTDEQQIDKLRVTGLLPLVDVVCTSDAIGASKPRRRAFEIFANRLGCAASEMAFVGDNAEVDVHGARSAGIAAGLVRHGGPAPTGLLAAVEAAR